jgi:hypothetical protein
MIVWTQSVGDINPSSHIVNVFKNHFTQIDNQILTFLVLVPFANVTAKEYDLKMISFVSASSFSERGL